MTQPCPQTAGLTPTDLAQLVAWRQHLHRHPELSGEEAATAATVAEMLRATGPDQILTNLGGHGVAAVYDSGLPGPRILLRAELDALPIEEMGDLPYRSTVPGKAHLCGHDGHMAILAAMARLLGRSRPDRGAVILMFQPAEEDGSGAARVVGDPAFAALRPDFAFAIHNMPGMPLGHVAIVDGPASCASRGMRLHLTGRTAHAARPETGRSPMAALARLMPALAALGGDDLPTDHPDFARATVTHARLGQPAFGVAPGEAELFVTVRALTDARMDRLVAQAETLARAEATAECLGLAISYHDVFAACTNDPEAAAIVRQALDDLAIPHGPYLLPMRASEDFGRFGAGSRLALMLLGSGIDRPALHNPDFDFPDALIGTGAAILSRIVARALAPA